MHIYKYWGEKSIYFFLSTAVLSCIISAYFVLSVFILCVTHFPSGCFGCVYDDDGRSQWPRGLRCRSAAARLLRSWVRIPPGAWMFVCCECCVLSGTGLCDELITRPEDSYRLCCVVVCDLETSRMDAPYKYDISRLYVNNLTLILLTWRKWWAPNNASK